jgi:branched-subunit amino acid ABC-type transport system permease component
LSQTLNGVFLGSILALTAIGLSLVFGVMNVINFAHGAILVVGAYTTYVLTRVTGQFFFSVIAGVIVCLLLGALIERVFLRKLYDRERAQLAQVTLTFGIAFVIRELVIIRWGSTAKFVSLPEWASGTLNLGFTSYPTYRLIVMVLTGIVFIGFFMSLRRTKTGMMILAGSKDREMAQMSGIDVKRLGTIGFAVGAALAGLAGGLIGPIRNVYPLLGFDILLPAFVVVLTGGLGSITGTVVAALIIGQVITFTSLFASQASNVVIFGVMIVAIALRAQDVIGDGEVI